MSSSQYIYHTHRRGGLGGHGTICNLGTTGARRWLMYHWKALSDASSNPCHLSRLPGGFRDSEKSNFQQFSTMAKTVVEVWMDRSRRD